MRDKEELARIRQREFYLETAARFTKMADEYSPASYAANPLPIHGLTAVITVHASDHNTLEDEVRSISTNWYHFYTNYGQAERRDSVGGRESVRFEHVYPEQTEERYMAELDAWSKDRKAKRAEK